MDNFAGMITIASVRNDHTIILQDGELRVESGYPHGEYVSNPFESPFRDLFYLGQAYRKLSGDEIRKFDAMHRIRVSMGTLYLDGRRIKTNVLWVRRVYAAYHWEGGILLAGETSLAYRFKHFPYSGQEFGYIDTQTGRCHFVQPFGMVGGRLLLPEFIVPVTVNYEDKSLEFDVKMPRMISVNGRFDLTMTVTNRSKKTMGVPFNLFDGLGMNRGPKRPYFHERPGRRLVPLEPSETHSQTVTIDAKSLGYSRSHPPSEKPSRQKIVFFWDFMPDPADRTKISRFVREKSYLLTDMDDFTVITGNKDLALEVELPKKVARNEKLECFVSLTNVSDRPISIPNSLLSGLRIYLWTARTPYTPGRSADAHKYPELRVSPRSKSSLLMPNETRRTYLSIDARPFFGGYGKELLIFTWDGYFNPDDESEITRFSVEKKIKVTEW